jgi:hypothetical protein
VRAWCSAAELGLRAPISADGQFGIFIGHTFIVTESGNECIDDFPWELAVAD